MIQITIEMDLNKCLKKKKEKKRSMELRKEEHRYFQQEKPHAGDS